MTTTTSERGVAPAPAAPPGHAPDSAWRSAERGRLELGRRHARRLRYLGPLRARRPALAYVGWLGYGNVGDEALFQAFRLAFPGMSLAHVSHERLLRLARSTGALRGRLAAVLLGGGTLIGHATFRRHTEWLLEADPGRPGFALGTGVLDPVFPDRSPREAREELERWRPLLARLERVTVRGPRSRELLADLGVEAELVGDPALLLRPPVAAPPRDERLLGLNVGFARDTWGGSPEELLRAVESVGHDWVADGGRVELFPMGRSDLPLVDEAVRRIGAGASVFAAYEDLAALLAGLQRCDVFAGLKLHAVVLAAAAGVPGVMIEYHPKCRDFQASIGRDRFIVRTDELTPGRLRELTFAVAAERDEQAAELERAVARHRDALGRETQAIESAARRDP